MAFTRDWSNSTPQNSGNASDGALEIRNSKVDVADRLAALFYGFTAGENSLDAHAKKLVLREQASVAQPSANYGALYAKEASGVAELYYQDENAAEKQITSGGKLNIVAADIPADLIDDTKIRARNNQSLRWRNAANSADISGLKVNASNLLELMDGSVTATSAAPTEDAGVSNKKYVVDTVDAAKPDVYRSSWTAVAANTAYTFTHGLGALPDVVRIYYSDTADGSGDVVTADCFNASERQMAVVDLTTTQITVRTGAYGVAAYRDASGNLQQQASGYAKVVAIKYN